MDDLFSCVAEPGKPTLVMTRTFDAPREDVFEAWTTPEQVALWWDPTGAPLAVCEIDLRPGGAFRWINQGEIGAKHPFAGVYREIVPPNGWCSTSEYRRRARNNGGRWCSPRRAARPRSP